MAVAPGFAATARCAIAAISTANTNRDGTGTIGAVFTAGSSGSRIDTILVEATGTTTAGMVRLYIYNGTTAYLFKELPVLAITPSGTVAAWGTQVNSTLDRELPIIIPTGYSLRASTHNAETFNVIAMGGDL